MKPTETTIIGIVYDFFFTMFSMVFAKDIGTINAKISEMIIKGVFILGSFHFAVMASQ